MLTRKFLLIGLLCAGTVAMTLPQASFAASWKFEVTNKSKVPVKSFRTKEGSEWSSNWIKGEKIVGGDTYEMDFGTADGECVVRTRITFTDDSYFDEDIDYCKVSKIDLYENTLKTN